MSSKSTYEPGKWLAICDICGFRFKSDELKKNYKGLMVCAADFETRHPQEFVRTRAEKVAVPWARPEGEDVFLKVCFVWERSAYADLATADCSQADLQPAAYRYLRKLKEGL